MSRAISRDSFNALKNYLGVYLQQGRVMLDADWNENQDINLSLLRHIARDLHGDGTPNGAFAIQPSLYTSRPDAIGIGDLPPMSLAIPGHPLFFFLNFPGRTLDGFDSVDDFSVTTPGGVPAKGTLQIVKRHGRSFLRLSGHAGTVRVMKKFDPAEDGVKFAGQEIATFRFRLNTPHPGTIKFVLKDKAGRETTWSNTNTAFASDVWLPAFAMPLDARFHILTSSVPPAALNQFYAYRLSIFGGEGPFSLVDEDDVLDDVHVEPPAGRAIPVRGVPLETGSFAFTVRVRDVTGQLSPPRELVFRISESGSASEDVVEVADLTPLVESDPAPVDLSNIDEYGFELFQSTQQSLVWDLDDLCVANHGLQRKAAENDFVIRSSRVPTLLSLTAIEKALGQGEETFQETVDRVKSLIAAGQPGAENAGRFYAAGLQCLQPEDLLFSQQRDPQDPPFTTPPVDSPRDDTVYLDAWTEPVTYVEDADIREVALGGPDTATRMVVRHKVRVSENGKAPAGNGIGDGRLSTAGSYTGVVNRLYRVEIDTAGDIGSAAGDPATATFRWSDDNASTIQRIVEDVPGGATAVVVEDASAFQEGDSILIRNDVDTQEHVISSLVGNRIELLNVTAAFPLASKPRIERWNAFRVPILIDPDDRAFSPAVALNDGVSLRFSGQNFLRGDYWIFKARQLAERAPQALTTAGHLESLDCARPRGVLHHFTPLATLRREAGDAEPAIVDTIEDLRAGATVVVKRHDIPPVPAKEPLDGGLPSDQEFELALTPSASTGAHLARLVGKATITDGDDTEGLLVFRFEFLAANKTTSVVVDSVDRNLHLPAIVNEPLSFDILASLSRGPLDLLRLRIPVVLRVSVTRKSSHFIKLDDMRLVVFERRTRLAGISDGEPART